METTCYRCGSAVEDQTSFCPFCGAPQIRVSVPRPYVSETQEVAPAPPPPAWITPLRVGPTNRIDWKAFLRVASPLAAAVALFSALVPPVGWLILLPGGIILAVHIYRRRRAGPLGAWQGAKLGACAGLLVFAFSSIIFGVAVSRDPAGYRLEADKTIQSIKELENRNPEAPHLSRALSGGRGMVLFTAMSLASLLVFLLVIGGISGAVAASLVRHRSSP